MINVAIVGAGIVGASVAYWLTRIDPSLSVLLIERDRSFAKASSSLSASSIRQQFSSAVNIRMSLFGVQFLREFGVSGHGMQHAAAAGRGVAELILSGEFRTLDLSSLGFERVISGRPLREANVIG